MSSYTGNMIRKIRLEKKLTQKQLGDLCGIADSNIRKYESGKQNPKLETLEKIANALNISIMDLMHIETMNITDDMISLFAGHPPKALPIDLSELQFLYCCLNKKGQNKIIDYARDITKIPEYRKEDAPDPEE